MNTSILDKTNQNTQKKVVYTLLKENIENITHDNHKTTKKQIFKGIYEFRINILESTKPSSMGWDILLFIYNEHETIEYIMNNNCKTIIQIYKDSQYSFFNATYGEVKFNFTIKKIEL